MLSLLQPHKSYFKLSLASHRAHFKGLQMYDKLPDFPSYQAKMLHF